MKKIFFISLLLYINIFTSIKAQETTINGRVVSIISMEHIPYAKVYIKNTSHMLIADEQGYFSFQNIQAGNYTIGAQALGFLKQEKTIEIINEVTNVQFELVENFLQLDQVVVSADRTETNRKDATVVVSTINPYLFSLSQSPTLAEGLNFCPGLRLENNCQNCGFTQVRMNGLEGPYSQILINSRPIFSGLAGVYGLELIPASMIERVEVVRGGGSALYGGNAIAGTINLVLQEPTNNTYNFGVNSSLVGVGMDNTGGVAPDISANFNTSLVSESRNSGIAIYGFARERAVFDANNDGFSEIAPMKNVSLGSRYFYKKNKSKISLDALAIYEDRAGGNMHEYPLHQRDVAEAVTHNLYTTALSFDRSFRERDALSAYASIQYLNRDSYYGAKQSLSDYGNSKDITYNVGSQYKTYIEKTAIIVGLDNTGNYLTDIKLGYPDIENAVIVNDTIVEIPHVDNTIVSNQSSQTIGVFAQAEREIHNTKITLGGRVDSYTIQDVTKQNETKSGLVVNPRVSIKQRINREWQTRISYAKGYRAPQIFDEDLHIETSGARQVINVNDADLKQETSHSITASVDYSKQLDAMQINVLVEGFYTRLIDPFVNEIGEVDDNGTVLYTRVNAEGGARVQGVNVDVKVALPQNISFVGGLTAQQSMYDEKQEFNETRFFRSPNTYGFFGIDWDFKKSWCLMLTGNYTGSMLVPYFGPNADEHGELRTSNPFFDAGIKLEYTHTIQNSESEIIWYIGIKNLLNAYQNDFDIGVDRDPSYMYGPTMPRSLNFGVTIGNIL